MRRPPAAAFAALAVTVWRAGMPTDVDRAIARIITAHRPPAITPVARAVTAFGSTPVAYPVLAAHAWRSGRWNPLVVALCAAITRRLLAEVIDRQRPPSDGWLATVTGPSFPSRHTATAAVVAGLLADSSTRHPRTARTAAHGATAAVAVSRVWLGVHWPTDVVGGWLFGAAWLSAARSWPAPRETRGLQPWS